MMDESIETGETAMKDHLKALAVVVVLLCVGAGAWQWLSKGPQPSAEIERTMSTLPAIELKTIDGRTFKTSDVRGKILIVNFWASWCGPCVEEVPSLARLSEKMGDDLRILAISGDTGIEDINVFLKSFPAFKRPGIDIVWDEGLKASKMFDVIRLPESYIYDGQGHMARKIAGSIDWSADEAVQYMKALKK